MRSAGVRQFSDRRAAAVEPGGKPARIEVGSFVLNRLARVVRVDGAEVMLTRLEFDLLSLLADNEGGVLDYEFLYRRLWPGRVTDDRRTLYVHIRRLRMKLRRAPLVITTVASIGYRLDFPA